MTIKSIFHYCLYIVISLSLFTSCTQDDLSFTVGEKYIDDNSYITQSDTFTVKLSTVKYDSVATSGYNRILIGNTLDTNVGKITASSYLQIGVKSDNGNINNDIINVNCTYDSICLVLSHDGYYNGDTTVPSNLNVYRLTQSYEDLDQTTFYQNNNISAEDTPIGTLTYTATPNYINKKENGEIRVRLSDEWGKELFDKLLNNSDSTKNNQEFLDYLPGILIKADEGTSSPIIGYKVSSDESTPSIKLYYHQISEVPIEEPLSFSFPVINSTNQFNNINIELTEGELSNLISQEDVLPAKSLKDNISYVQSGIGLMTRIDFPYLNDLHTFAKKGVIIDATLLLEPVKGTYDASTLPSTLSLYYCDKVNRLAAQLTDYQGNPTTPILYKDEAYNNDTYYSIDLTWYFQNLFTENYYNSDYGVMVQLPESTFRSTLEKVIFGGQGNKGNSPKLIINYFTYE